MEGGAGPYALTIPSAPQWLFAREDGERCQLKWAANPEQKVRGYRVYRMESPRVNGPGQKVSRLTDEPVAATRLTSRQAPSALGSVPSRVAARIARMCSSTAARAGCMSFVQRRGSDLAARNRRNSGTRRHRSYLGFM